MGEIAIHAENLSKRYPLRERAGYKSLRDLMARTWKAPARCLRSVFRSDSAIPHPPAGKNTGIWAIKDISFEIRHGEITGIIGRNGAGKSTLLKILSRITSPSGGNAEIHGRVGSLLEVGTGFHRELTGRENIFLNGAVLGMRKKEIERKFDAIVAFSEVERFIDTPVKYYSSGMFVKLAFAVAAYLEPEILLVDEVLAVGDAAFQKKCLGKMNEVARGGRTILFVSHNMGIMSSFCERGLLLEGGQLILQGTAGECVDHYMQQHFGHEATHTVSFTKPPNSPLWMISATVLCNGAPSALLTMGGDLSLQAEFKSENELRNPRIRYLLSSAQGVQLISASNRYQPSSGFPSPVRSGRILCHLGQVPLMEGSYFISLWLGDDVQDWHVTENALSFRVLENDVWGTGKLPTAEHSHLWYPTQFEMVPHYTHRESREYDGD